MTPDVDLLRSRAEDFAAQFERGQEESSIDGAIDSAREALKLCEPGHPERSVSLIWLANYLKTRYTRFNTPQDLDEAIEHGREALSLCPPGHPDRSMCLNNLSIDLSTRFNLPESRKPDDLDQAITFSRDVLRLHPLGHPLRPTSLESLGACLFNHYNQPESLNALKFFNEAIANDTLSNLEAATTRKAFNALDNLNEAIVLSREALSLCPLGHPLRLSVLHSLANRLKTRYTNLKLQPGNLKVVDREELFTSSIFIQLKDTELFEVTSLEEFSVVKAWIAAAEDLNHSTTLSAYATAFRILIHHLATLPSFPQQPSNIMMALALTLAVDAFSAGIRNSDFAQAVELLEQGRSIFWSQLACIHSSPEDVSPSVSAIKSLSANLKLPIPRLVSRFRDRDTELSANSIVGIPQLVHPSRFFLSSPVFLDLQQAAVHGPVIIVNASTQSCDALVVLQNQDPVHVSLPTVTKQGARDLISRYRALVRPKSETGTKDFENFLRELWDKVVSPVVDKLRPIHPPSSESRIWWCPTAEFTFLPLHAAGPYNGQPNLPDLYVSSYTPTLNSLVRARRRVQPRSEGQVRPKYRDPVPTSPVSDRKQRFRFTRPSSPFKSRDKGPSKVPIDAPNVPNTPEKQTEAITQANSSEGEPVSVSKELNSVGVPKTGQHKYFLAIGKAKDTGGSGGESASGELLVKIGQLVDKYATFVRMEGPGCGISRVAEELSWSQWVHLACDVISNEKQPSESALNPGSERLTIGRIIQRELENPEFAYLSTSHSMTQATSNLDEGSPDEVIHLAAAMQFVGFRSVIGTIGAMDEDHTDMVTSAFYKHIVDKADHLDHTKAALALDQTMKELKDMVPIDKRILYVHIGA